LLRGFDSVFLFLLLVGFALFLRRLFLVGFRRFIAHNDTTLFPDIGADFLRVGTPEVNKRKSDQLEIVAGSAWQGASLPGG
jgi:hypothetical protein